MNEVRKGQELFLFRKNLFFGFTILLFLGWGGLTFGKILLAAENEPALSAGESKHARAAFERFKKLKGDWIARSSKGWEERISFEPIARGSVVMETNRFQDAPDRTMLTMIHMDGDRLILTHYCEARNQPRLVGTLFENEGRRITFTFLDGTNLSSRDQGHMDKAVYEFIDDDHFSSRWTWYQNGKEDWLEDIVLVRIP